MKKEKQIQIADSFSELNEKSELDITISKDEFQVLENGIFAKNMDEKWNVFTIDNNIFFARSWTNYCIYKVNYELSGQTYKLKEILITRNKKQYRSQNLEHDVNMFKRILQMYLKREDIFIDERLQIGLIKKTIEEYDPNNIYKKSVGKQSVELNNRIYNGLLKSSSEVIRIEGLKEFQNNLSKYNSDYELLSLHLSKRNQPKESTTFYFNEDASECVGQITITNKKEGS